METPERAELKQKLLAEYPEACVRMPGNGEIIEPCHSIYTDVLREIDAILADKINLAGAIEKAQIRTAEINGCTGLKPRAGYEGCGPMFECGKHLKVNKINGLNRS